MLSRLKFIELLDNFCCIGLEFLFLAGIVCCKDFCHSYATSSNMQTNISMATLGTLKSWQLAFPMFQMKYQ